MFMSLLYLGDLAERGITCVLRSYQVPLAFRGMTRPDGMTGLLRPDLLGLGMRPQSPGLATWGVGLDKSRLPAIFTM